MAKLKLSALVPDGDFFTTLYEDQFDFGNHSGTKATFIERAGDGDYYTLHGKGFAYDGQTLTHGTIKSVTFFNAEGVAYATFTGLNLKADNIDHDPWLSIGDLLEKGFRGNTVIQGSSGDDYIFGGGSGGKDTVSGKGGSDIFFVDDKGNTVITDFDAIGGGDLQDYVSFSAGGKTVKHGPDTVYEFENGHTVTFLDVRYKDLGVEDLLEQ